MAETMTVVVNGVEEERVIDHIEVQQIRSVAGRLDVSKPVPVLKDGEHMYETVGGMIHITSPVVNPLTSE